MKWAALLLALGLLQDRLVEVKIPRSDASNYRKVLIDFKNAAKQIQEDPQGCLESCSRIIDEVTSHPDTYSRIRDTVECNLRLEAPTGGYGDPAPFTPYLFRGRARLSLVKVTKGMDVGNALKEMIKVVGDLKIANDRGSDAKEDLARADARIKEINALVGPPPPPTDGPEARAKAALETLKGKLEVDPPGAMTYYDQNSKVFSGTRYDAEAILVRRTAVLMVKVGQKDYEGVLKYCDEAAPFVRGTTYARTFDLERGRAGDEILRAKERETRDLMIGIRSLAAAGEHAKVIAEYDRIAAKLKLSEYAPELEKLVKDAREAQNAGAVSKVLMKLDPLEMMLADANPDPVKVLNEAALIAPAVKETPSALAKLNQIRDRAKVRLQAQWSRLCDEKKFSAAAKLLEGAAKHLTEPELKSGNDEIRKRCAAYLVATQKSLQSALADALRLPSPYETLSGYTPEDLRRILAVPDDRDLVLDPDPALVWGGDFRKSLELILAGGDPARSSHPDFLKTLELLNASVVASVGLVAGDAANFFFKGSESLSFDLARRRLTAVVDQAKPAGRDKRNELREQGDAVSKSMAGLIARIDLTLQKSPDKGKAFRQKFDLPAHMATIDEIWKKFPKDVDRIAKIWEELFGQPSKGAYGASPLTDLEVREKELWALYDSSWGSLAVESRKELARCLMVTTVMHHLLAGKRAQDVAQSDDVRKEKRLLAEVGGLTEQDLKGISPKVRKVIEAVKP